MDTSLLDDLLGTLPQTLSETSIKSEDLALLDLNVTSDNDDDIEEESDLQERAVLPYVLNDLPGANTSRKLGGAKYIADSGIGRKVAIVGFSIWLCKVGH